MPCEDDVNEGSATVCAAYYMRTVLDVFPKTQGLLDFHGFFEVTVLMRRIQPLKARLVCH